MSLGVGQLLLGSIIGGGLLGGLGKKEEQQPTQVASNTQPQQQGGFGNMLTNVSNSMFAGMSQEQVYRMGQGFNTLRFEPSDKMHDSFETRIQTIRANKAATDKANTTVQYLKGKKLDGLADLVSLGLLPPQDAITKSLEKADIPDWQGKLDYVINLMANMPEGGEIPWYLHGILDIPDQPEKSDIEVRLEALSNLPIDKTTGLTREWTDLELEVGFGIQPDDISVFRDELAAIDELAAGDPETYTEDVVREMKLDKLRSTYNKTELPNSAKEYKYYKDNLTPGQVPISYLEFKSGGGGGDATSIEEYKFYETQAKARGETPISYFDWKNQSGGGEIATSIEEYEYYKDNLAEGETPITYKEWKDGKEAKPSSAIENYEYYKNNTKDVPVLTFKEYQLAMKAGGTDIDIDLGTEIEDAYALASTASLVEKHNIIIDGKHKIVEQIKKLHRMQDILDMGDEGKIRTGVFEPMYTMASRVMEGLGLSDGTQATAIQLLQSAQGSDVFPLIGALGIGARGMDTPEERKFLQMSFVGDVSMQIEALKVMTANRLRIMTEALEVFNQRVNERTQPAEGLEATFENTHSAYFKLYEQTHKYKIQPLVMPVRAKVEAAEVNAIVSQYY